MIEQISPRPTERYGLRGNAAVLPCEAVRANIADLTDFRIYDQIYGATVKGMNPSEKSPLGMDLARQWSWYRPGANAGAEAARTSGSLSWVGTSGSTTFPFLVMSIREAA